jgi:hypothetical protein
VWALCAHTVLYFGFGVRYARIAFDFAVDLPTPCSATE